MFNYCQHCATRLWSDYAKTLGDCPECEEPDKPLQDLEDDLESIFNQPKETLCTSSGKRKRSTTVISATGQTMAAYRGTGSGHVSHRVSP